MAREKILVVEDDEFLGQHIIDLLHRAEFEVEWLRDGTSAMWAELQGFALLVLDLMLPGAPGLEILARWRESSDLPVLVLSATNQAEVKVCALEIGADDYLTMPFWPEELLARVRARLRRPFLGRSGRIETGPIAIDESARRVCLAGRDVELTRVEFDLLCALARRPDAAVDRRWLVENILDPRRRGDGRTLDVHFSRLRKKLGAVGRRLVTVRGVGYRLRSVDPD